MRRKESKYKSSLFNSCHNWFRNHGIQLLAVGFLVAAVGLGTLQAESVYAEGGDYGGGGSPGASEYNFSLVLPQSE